MDPLEITTREMKAVIQPLFTAPRRASFMPLAQLVVMPPLITLMQDKFGASIFYLDDSISSEMHFIN